jgi:hypothetical protein
MIVLGVKLHKLGLQTLELRGTLLLMSLDLLLDLEKLKVVLLEIPIVRLQLGSPCDEL